MLEILGIIVLILIIICCLVYLAPIFIYIFALFLGLFFTIIGSSKDDKNKISIHDEGPKSKFVKRL